MTLNEIEQDYITFLAERRDVARQVVNDAYLAARSIVPFQGESFRRMADSLHVLFSPVYGQETEADLIRSYQFHAPLHLYRMIAYSYRGMARYEALARYLSGTMGAGSLDVVDYGCGLAYASLTLAKFHPQHTYTLLVDVDGLILDFAAWRFRRYGLMCRTIPVTRDNPYPELPHHNICLAIEVMEHLKQPLLAYQHIHEAMVDGGLLGGRFRDHRRQPFHVSPDLSAIRAELERDYRCLRPSIYQKVAA